MKEVTIGKNDAGQRLDKFLFKTFPDLPASILYKAIRLKPVSYTHLAARAGRPPYRAAPLTVFVFVFV